MKSKIAKYLRFLQGEQAYLILLAEVDSVRCVSPKLAESVWQGKRPSMIVVENRPRALFCAGELLRGASSELKRGSRIVLLRASLSAVLVEFVLGICELDSLERHAIAVVDGIPHQIVTLESLVPTSLSHSVGGLHA